MSRADLGGALVRPAANVTERVARACADRPGRTLGIWAAVVVAALASIILLLGGLTSNAHVVGSPESQRAAQLDAQAFPPTAAERAHEVSDVVIVSSSRHTVADPEFRSETARVASQLRTRTAATNVRSYLDGARTLVSADGHAAVIPVLIPDDNQVDAVVQVAKAASTGSFDVGVTGDRTIDQDMATQSQKDLENGELKFGLPAAMIVLLLVFGAVVGGLVPLLMAVLAILVGLGIVAVLSTQVTLSVFIVNMLTGMGLALGIDYSLFGISRYREERASGLDKRAAISRAGATANRAVLTSGATFVVALVGMLIVPTTIMRSLAAGAIIVGVVSVVAALTLLPALLALLGDRVNALRVPVVGRRLGRPGNADGRFWHAVVSAVVARPAVSLVVSTAALLVAAAPLLGMHIGSNGVSTLPTSLPSRHGYALAERYFPQLNPYRVDVLVRGTPNTVQPALGQFVDVLRGNPAFGAPSVRSSTDRTVAEVSLPVRGDADSSAAVTAVRRLRASAHQLLAPTGATVAVGGHTAEQIDYYDAVTGPTPLVLTFVLGLSYLLLTVAFRSVVVALVSILLNLLSVGAAYGLLTLVFLDGHGTSLFAFTHVGVVDAWVPLFLFSVLFGLSLDYQVLLMTRIKERHDRGAPTREAVAIGVASTARIITGAALIIVVVFAGFARGDLVMFQQMGFGVAVALLIDATLIRSVVLPSALALLGRRTWYLPSWLRWLPRVDVEGPDPAPETVPTGA